MPCARTTRFARRGDRFPGDSKPAGAKHFRDALVLNGSSPSGILSRPLMTISSDCYSVSKSATGPRFVHVQKTPGASGRTDETMETGSPHVHTSRTSSRASRDRSWMALIGCLFPAPKPHSVGFQSRATWAMPSIRCARPCTPSDGLVRVKQQLSRPQRIHAECDQPTCEAWLSSDSRWASGVPGTGSPVLTRIPHSAV